MKFNKPHVAFLIPLIFRKYNRSYVENSREDELHCFSRETFSILNRINIQSPQCQKSTSLQGREKIWGLCYGGGKKCAPNLLLYRGEPKIFENRKTNAPCPGSVTRHQVKPFQKVTHSGYPCSLISETSTWVRFSLDLKLSPICLLRVSYNWKCAEGATEKRGKSGPRCP